MPPRSFAGRLAGPRWLARCAWNSPGCLLLLVGILLGCNFPLGKLATRAGVAPLVWATLIAVSAAAVLGVAAALLRTRIRLDWQHARYFGVTALLSHSVPGVATLMVVAHVGSGWMAALYALSPIMTTAFGALAGMRRPGPLEIAGIAAGLFGVVIIAFGKGDGGHGVAMEWIALGTLVPCVLAVGNVYRTLDWPPDTNVHWLALGTNIVSSLILGATLIATGQIAQVRQVLDVPLVAVAQVVASSSMFAAFFRLQKVGGPVTLSQIGTVAAGVGVAAGAWLLGERYPSAVWTGVALVAAGTACTVVSRSPALLERIIRATGRIGFDTPPRKQTRADRR